MSDAVVVTNKVSIPGMGQAGQSPRMSEPNAEGRAPLAFADTAPLAELREELGALDNLTSGIGSESGAAGQVLPASGPDQLVEFSNVGMPFGVAGEEQTGVSAQSLTGEAAVGFQKPAAEGDDVAMFGDGSTLTEACVAEFMGGENPPVVGQRPFDLAECRSEVLDLPPEKRVPAGSGPIANDGAVGASVMNLCESETPATALTPDLAGVDTETPSVLQPHAALVAAAAGPDHGSGAVETRDPVAAASTERLVQVQDGNAAPEVAHVSQVAQYHPANAQGEPQSSGGLGPAEANPETQRSQGSLPSETDREIQAGGIGRGVHAGRIQPEAQGSPVGGRTDVGRGSIVESVDSGRQLTLVSGGAGTDNVDMETAVPSKDGPSDPVASTVAHKVVEKPVELGSERDLAPVETEGQRTLSGAEKPSPFGLDNAPPAITETPPNGGQPSRLHSPVPSGPVSERGEAIATASFEDATRAVTPTSVLPQAVATVTSPDASTLTPGPFEAGTTSHGHPAAGISQQIADSVQASLRGSDKELEVRLNPPELGRIFVRLEERGELITGVLEISKSETRGEIERALPQVIETLQEAGVQVRRLDLTVADQQEREFGRDQLQEDASGQHHSPEGDEHPGTASRSHSPGTTRLQQNFGGPAEAGDAQPDWRRDGIDMLA